MRIDAISLRNFFFFTIFLLLSFWFFPLSSPGDDSPPVIDFFTQANQEYVNGKYEDAISLYKEMISSGKTPPEVYYNLGNAYARTGSLGRAILNYERARRQHPRDGDVLNNLKHAKSLLTYRVEDKRNPFVKGVEKTLGYFSNSEIALAGAFFYTLWIFSFLIQLIYRLQNRFKKIIQVFFVFAVIFLIPLVLKFTIFSYDEAIVVAKQAEVKYGPSRQDKTAFRLGEGLSVYVKEARGDWFRVSLSDGTRGWILHDSIEKVF